MLRKIFSSKLVFYFLLISPIIDVITSVMIKLNINITFGILVKMIILFFVTIYLLFFDEDKKINYVVFAIMLLFSIGNIINNFDIITSHFLEYFSYLFKYIYFIVMSLYFIKYIKKNKFELESLKYPMMILSIIIVLSNLTGTYFYSYDVKRLGNSAWYSSANEFGSLLTLFYPLSIFVFMDKKNARLIDVVFVLIIAFGLINLGTKVGLIAIIITNAVYLIYRLVNFKKYKLNKSFLVILLMSLGILIFFNNLPTVVNVRNKYNFINSQNPTSITENETDEKIKKKENNIFVKVLFSGRIDYLLKIQGEEKIVNDYLFGKMYVFDNGILLVESDAIDIFYMYGIIGSMIVYVYLLSLIVITIKKYFKNLGNSFQYLKINMILLSIALVLLISVLVGHTLSSPSVSIYLSLLCAYVYNYDAFKKQENKKIKILIGAVHMQVGGIETVLINLLNKIDYNKYDVDLFLLLKNGSNLNKLNENVKIITPYSGIFDKFYARESRLSKIFKHLLYNRYTSFLYQNDKFYDVAIDYTGYYPFITKYISQQKAGKKIVWVHTDVKMQYETSSNYKKRFEFYRKIYKKYNVIVCVGPKCKESFSKKIPGYDDKLRVVNNIIEIEQKHEIAEQLDGNYIIVGVGRLCYAKNFERFIEVHEKLIKNGYNVNSYIIGNGKDYKKLNDMIERKKISSSIKLLGEKPNALSYIKQANLLLTTSRYEAWATVLLEAMSVKTPWVGPMVTGIEDMNTIAPKGSYILTKNTTKGLYEGVKQAIDGKVNKNFAFDINKYNANCLTDFYNVIGEENE